MRPADRPTRDGERSAAERGVVLRAERGAVLRAERGAVLRAERGAITMFAAIATTVLVLIALSLTEAGALIAMRHRSAAAADLAALAASRASTAGDEGCAAARAVAVKNRAEVVACRMDADVATVTARTTSSRWWGMRWRSDTKARAAPDFYFER